MMRDLEQHYARYDGAAPEGAQAVQAEMRDGINAMYRALEHVLVYLDEDRFDPLDEAVASALEAQDIFNNVEYLLTHEVGQDA